MFRLATLVNNSNGQNKHTYMLSGFTNVAEFTCGIVLPPREIALGRGSIGIRTGDFIINPTPSVPASACFLVCECQTLLPKSLSLLKFNL